MALEWAAIGAGAVTLVGVPLARRYGSRLVNKVVDAFANGDTAKVPPNVNDALEGIVRERVAKELARAKEEAAKRIVIPRAKVRPRGKR